MYPVFAGHARAAGETELAARFEQFAEDERAHRDAFARVEEVSRW